LHIAASKCYESPSGASAAQFLLATITLFHQHADVGRSLLEKKHFIHLNPDNTYTFPNGRIHSPVAVVMLSLVHTCRCARYSGVVLVPESELDMPTRYV
jgi:hypothetical protein